MTPNTPLIVSALGWIDDRAWGRRRRQLCHEILARQVAEKAELVPFGQRELYTRIPGRHRSHDAVLLDLVGRDVLAVERPGGSAPNRYGMSELVYRWKVPWAIKRVEVLVRVERFLLRAPEGVTTGGVATQGQPRGQKGGSPTQGQPQGHKRGGARSATQGQPQGQKSAACDPPGPRSARKSGGHNGSALSVSLDRETTSYVGDDDGDQHKAAGESLELLRTAILQASGGEVWRGTTPERDLAAIATRMNGDVDKALTVIEQLGRQGTRSPVIYVATLAELLGAEGTSAAGMLERRRLEERLGRLNALRAVDGKWELEAAEIESQLAKMGT